MNIVDCHGHIFPPLAGACGFSNPAEHLLYLQWGMHTHGTQPVVRTRDGQIVKERHLWDPEDPSETGRRKGLNFRVGGHGRLAWDVKGESYHVQFLSPGTRNLESPAETIVAQMDYAGIATMVLQNDHLYGNSAAYFAEAVNGFPDRFIGLAQVEEGFAWQESEIQRLEHQVTRCGMAGLYFTLSGFMRSGWKTTYADSAFDDFWLTVHSLGIPVFWVFPAATPWGSFLEEMNRFVRWYERFPAIRTVIVHGWPTTLFADGKGRIRWPGTIAEIQQAFPVYTEILHPIGWGRHHAYPYEAALDHIRQFYDCFGAGPMIWGSDMPNVERFCTYRQSLDYAYMHSDFMTSEERSGVFGETCLSLFAPFGVE